MTAELLSAEREEVDARRASDPTSAAAAPVRRVLQGGLYALPVVAFLGAGFTRRSVVDDGFIYLRVVQQIRAGNGPVFNAGERVEAFTGTLWVALLSIADLLTPVRLEWLAVLLGLVAGAAGLGCAIAGARRLLHTDGDRRWFLPLGAVVFVSVTPVWLFATSGLETGLVFGWLGACLLVLASWARTPDTAIPLRCAVLLGLGWLVRPDLVLFSAAFLGIVVVAEWRRGRRRLARVVVAATALPLAYQVFRMGYYGSLVPNTALAKEAGAALWDRGWRYLRDFADPYWLWVPAVGLVVGGYLPLATTLRSVRARLIVVAFIACGVLHSLYVIRAGGDYMHGRLLLPGFFALCAPVAVVPATRRHLAGALVAPWALVSVLTLRPDQYAPEGRFANGFTAHKAAGKVTTDDFGWGHDGPRRRWYVGPAVYRQVTNQRVLTSIEPRADLELPLGLFSGVGRVSYSMGPDFHVVDILGLADPLTARLETGVDVGPPVMFPRLPGHEKPLPGPWQAALVTPPGSRPDPEQFPAGRAPLIEPTTGREFQEQVAWARATLRCPEIVELRNAANAPLTPGRFGDNFVGSFRNTRLRIPPDPEQAYQRFCGPGTPPEVRAVRAG